MGRGRDRRHCLRKRVPPCKGGKTCILGIKCFRCKSFDCEGKLALLQMLMQNQNLRPQVSLNQPLIHQIQECKIFPVNHVLIQLNPRAQVFPCKKRICISMWCNLNPRLLVFGRGHQSCVSIWFIDIRDCKSILLRPLVAASLQPPI